jgi:hypothetical protein
VSRCGTLLRRSATLNRRLARTERRTTRGNTPPSGLATVFDHVNCNQTRAVAEEQNVPPLNSCVYEAIPLAVFSLHGGPARAPHGTVASGPKGFDTIRVIAIGAVEVAAGWDMVTADEDSQSLAFLVATYFFLVVHCPHSFFRLSGFRPKLGCATITRLL